jgi:deazaflavin-dependent oxidoreductase (nitroreductase family)
VTDIRYSAPGWFTTHVFNRAVRRLTLLGISVMGSRELRVRGRSTGEWRSTPVNLLTFQGERYLVAPRGTTQWVRNLRVAGSGELRVGRRTEPFDARELPDEVKSPILHDYLRRWAWEVGAFFPGLTANSSDEDVQAVASGFPVFQISPRR